jgi:hypothetical protein
MRGTILEKGRIPSSQRYDTYLGLLALVGKSQMIAFKVITDRVWKKLQDWKIKILSQAGKEIILKAVVQAIPILLYECFSSLACSMFGDKFTNTKILERSLRE